MIDFEPFSVAFHAFFKEKASGKQDTGMDFGNWNKEKNSGLRHTGTAFQHGHDRFWSISVALCYALAWLGF